MVGRFLTQVRAFLSLPTRLDGELRRVRKEVEDSARVVQDLLKAQQKRFEAVSEKQAARTTDLERELSASRKEVRDRLREYHLRLARLTRVLEGPSANVRMHSHAIPSSIATREDSNGGPRSPEWYTVDRCPACGTGARTLVCEWNKRILRPNDTDYGAAVYNYSLCQGCGLVYATKRPCGAYFQSLVKDFPETVGRNPSKSVGLLNAYPLSDEDRSQYRELIEGGVFVSDHLPRPHLSGIFKDRMENAFHVDILGSLLDLRRARVLEVRSRAGTILEGLRRHYGASVAAIPIFESQQFILRELYGIECGELIDFDSFRIGFPGQFDLITCNHILTHILRPERFFDEIRSHLRPGGHLYLYNEADEKHFLASGKSVLGIFNPLHFQAFDRPSFVRALKANGFETVFIKSRNGNQLCLARFVGERDWIPADEQELTRRVREYRAGRARMILKAPEEVRGRFSAVWDDTLEDAVTAGIARFDDKGALHLVKD